MAPKIELDDSTLRHLRSVVDLPDLSGTRYELGEEIGRGGLGVVYSARDLQLQRPVAIKVLNSGWPEELLAGMHLAEARLIARLEHPAIVPIYESGTLPDGRAFYAMKLVAGTRLDRYLDSRLPVSERLRVIRRIGEALAFAHTRGVLHRDLKPQNVMIGSFGEVYVMDWGVEGVAGTPPFRAPEQAASSEPPAVGGGAGGDPEQQQAAPAGSPTSDPLDRRVDVYALGAVLRFLLPDPPPRPLRALADKAMSADPADRYFDVPALLSDLQRFQDGLAVEACPDTLYQQAQRYARRNQVLLLLLAAFVAVKFFLFFLRKP